MKNQLDNSSMYRYKSVKDMNVIGSNKVQNKKSGTSVLNACIHLNDPFDEVR
jgi:hypothetical protein